MTPNSLLKTYLPLMFVAALMTACAAKTQITRLQPESDAINPPYRSILVVALFESFDRRRYLEQEVVKSLEASGTRAVAMTSLADSTVPLNRSTVLPLVQETGSDAVLVAQLSDLHARVELKNRRPESTYNIRPTYYHNVFSAELTEYTEPPSVQYKFELALQVDLFSVENTKSVWAVAAKTIDTTEADTPLDYSKYVDQASAIVKAMKRDRLIGR